MVCRRAPLVIAAAGLLTLLLGVFVQQNLKINTDTSDMLSPDLPFRRNFTALREAFPQFSDNMVIVLDGPNPDLVDEAAGALSARLKAFPGIFGAVFDPAGMAFFRRNGLLFLDQDELAELTANLAQAQPFLGTLWRDPSLPRLFAFLSRALDELDDTGQAHLPQLRTTLGAIAAIVRAQMAGRPDRLSWQLLMRGGKTPDAPARRIITLKPVLDYGSLQPGRQAMEKVRAMARELRLAEDFAVRVRLTGSVPLADEELRSVIDGLGLAGLLSLGLVLLLLFWGLRAPRLVFSTLATLIAGLIWTAAFAVAAVGTFNLISIAFAVLFIGLSVDFGIHYCLRYSEEMAAGAETPAALCRAAQKIGGALTLTAVAASIGFFSFLPTDYLGLAELGLIAGTGMAIALFTNLTILPAAIAVLPLRPGMARMGWAGVGTGAGTGAGILDLKSKVREYRRPILVLATLLGLGAAIALPQARFDFDPLNLKDKGTESVATLFDLMEDGGAGPYSSTVLVPGLAQAEALAARLRRLPEVEGVATLASFVPQDQARKLEMIEGAAFFLAPALAEVDRAPPSTAGARRQAVRHLARQLDAADAGRLRPDRGDLLKALADFVGSSGLEAKATKELENRLLASLDGRLRALRLSLEAVEISLKTLPRQFIRRQIAADGRARLEIHPREDLRDRRALQRFVGAIRQLAPDATGAPVIILEAGQAVIASFMQAGLMTLAALTLVLAVLFARLREILLIFAPILLAALLTVAAGLVFDLPFNFANVIVLPLLFGLGVAGGVHFVSRERAMGGSGGGGAGGVMATSTPRAVTFSALTTIGSFGSIALSSHPGTASMGALLSIAIVLVLLCTLLVLPALMAVWPAKPAR